MGFHQLTQETLDRVWESVEQEHGTQRRVQHVGLFLPRHEVIAVKKGEEVDVESHVPESGKVRHGGVESVNGRVGGVGLNPVYHRLHKSDLLLIGSVSEGGDYGCVKKRRITLLLHQHAVKGEERGRACECVFVYSVDRVLKERR